MKKYRNHSAAHKSTADSAAPSGACHPPEVFFDGAFWEENFGKFTLLADQRIATLPWHRQFNRRPPGGMEPADYVVKAAELLMSGTRKCRVEYSRETCVYGVLDSLISHDFGDPENAFAHDRIFMDNDAETTRASLPASDPSIEDAIAAREQLEKYKAYFADEKTRQFLDLIATEECETAADAAAALDIRESDVRNIVKVVRRRRDQWPGRPRPKKR